jgi:hypothetical protein
MGKREKKKERNMTSNLSMRQKSSKRDFLRLKQIFKYLIKQYKHLKTDAYIISFPKSGRTWLRILIGKALCEKFNLPDEIMLDTYKVTTSAGILCTQITHDSSSEKAGYKYYDLTKDKRKYSKKKVIFLVRDVKNVLISYYFQVTKRRDKYTGNISDFIRSDKYGIKKILSFYNIWQENMNVPKEFLLLRYEDMHKNPGEVLAKTMKFLGCDGVDEYTIRKAVDFASFNNMRKMEKDGFFKSGAMRPANINDDESYKLRRGIVGGYENYLSEEDIKYVDQIIKEMGCPFEQI